MQQSLAPPDMVKPRLSYQDDLESLAFLNYSQAKLVKRRLEALMKNQFLLLPEFPSRDELIEVDEMGQGSFGRVIRVFHIQRKEYYALKTVRATESFTDMLHEINLMIRITEMNNEWFCKLVSFSVDDRSLQRDSGEKFIEFKMLMELGMCSLYQYNQVRREFGITWTEQELSVVYGSMVNAIQALKGARIFHRDIKDRNIVITKDGRIKIIDFGVAQEIQEDADGLAGVCGGEGTPHYMAPEVGPRGDVRVHPYLCDLYSLGITMLRLGNVRVIGNSTINILRDIERFKEKYPVLGELVENALAYDPEERRMAMRLPPNIPKRLKIKITPREEYMIIRSEYMTDVIDLHGLRTTNVLLQLALNLPVIIYRLYRLVFAEEDSEAFLVLQRLNWCYIGYLLCCFVYNCVGWNPKIRLKFHGLRYEHPFVDKRRLVYSRYFEIMCPVVAAIVIFCWIGPTIRNKVNFLFVITVLYLYNTVLVLIYLWYRAHQDYVDIRQFLSLIHI
eukprot:TRINITY_DN12460_c0_g1_i3.p1 TRINITY_DN12460_c0_g1~~TRINITY_DN12460_c0_g1_i3.p1  ORF type:complete len:504 (-),score=32.66 TRINITY_DN12460_c0_g1_i3:69-1580(-)